MAGWPTDKGAVSHAGRRLDADRPGWIVAAPDVRVQFTTDDGVTVLLHYTGLVKPNPRFIKAATDGAATAFDDQYLRQIMRFETGDQRYLWITQEIYIAEGRLSGLSEIEYNVYALK